MTRHTWLKKIGGLLMAVCLSCSMAMAVPAAGDDLLQAGSWTEDWTFAPSAEDGATLAEVDGAAVITVTEGGAVLSKETKFSLEKSVNAVTFTAKAVNLEEGSEAVVRLFRAESTTVKECQSAPITEGEWETVTMYFKPGTAAKKLVEIALTGAGTLYIKNMTVTRYTGENLLPYGNAEAYTQTNPKFFTGGDSAVTTERKYEGLAAYSGKKFRTDVYPVEPGSTYLLSFAFYSAAAKNPRVQVGWNSTANAPTNYDFPVSSAGMWNTYSYHITVPETFGAGEEATAVTGIYLFFRTTDDSAVYYDAISLVKKDAGLQYANGSEASAPASGETVTAFTTVEAGKSGTAIVALYKKNGGPRTLIGIETAPIETAEAAQTATVNYTLPATLESGEYSLAIFAWDMKSGLSPLKDAYTHTWTVQ